MKFEELLLRLGELAGHLSLSEHRERLVFLLREDKLRPEYIVALRDLLTRVLRESGTEPLEG